MKYQNIAPTPDVLTGVGFRSFHKNHILKNKKEIAKNIGWFEVHSENYFCLSAPNIKILEKIRQDFPISLHCVGLSLGSKEKVDLNHLKDLKNLINFIEPFLVSDHISWSKIDGKFYNDLLPIPYNKESKQALCDNIKITQDFLQRQILVENPSSYLSFNISEIAEVDFINEVADESGCKILFDINNIFVSSQNNKNFDPQNYIKNLQKEIVGEIHLAGHSKKETDDGEILVDTHNNLVCKEVWDLFTIAAKKFNNIPVLIEWDQDFPKFEVLEDEVKRAKKAMNH